MKIIRIIKHLSNWRVAYDTDTGDRVYFNDKTMNVHCYSIWDVVVITVRETT